LIDYTPIDRSSALEYIFYPRDTYNPCPYYAFDVSIPVDTEVSILCRLFKGKDEWPWILYFHGNGEVVSDYDELAPFYFKRRINLAVTDYRGYGKSTGTPSITAMTHDARLIYRAIRAELAGRGLKDRLWIMGRSLGSVSALELAYHHQADIPGIIIESGFLGVARIMTHLNVPAEGIELDKIDAECLKMARSLTLPTLIIHGEYDNLVPFREAEDLYENIRSADKQLLMIPLADHNDIMFVGLNEYFNAIRSFVERTG
jgi:alpha-beta hydrolase superfamily lysophospholipase